MTDLATLAEQVVVYPRASSLSARADSVIALLDAAIADADCIRPRASFKARLRSRLVAAASRTARSAAGEQTGRTTSPTATRPTRPILAAERTPSQDHLASSSASTNRQK